MTQNKGRKSEKNGFLAWIIYKRKERDPKVSLFCDPFGIQKLKYREMILR